MLDVCISSSCQEFQESLNLLLNGLYIHHGNQPGWSILVSGLLGPGTTTLLPWALQCPASLAQLLTLTLAALTRRQRSLLPVALQKLGKIILLVAPVRSHSYFPVSTASEVGEPSSCSPALLQFPPLDILGYDILFQSDAICFPFSRDFLIIPAD